MTITDMDIDFVEPGYARTSSQALLDGSPATDIADLPGRLIVLEGTDNVGRSTQIALLREWLEARGFGVAHTALRRGRLASDGLNKAKQGHTLSQLAIDLFYATDFADRLENFILPALRAGFVVLTDRYVYSIMARSIVRGVDPQWIADVYQFAPRPHAVFYLKSSLDGLLPRTLAGEGFDFWESGMDFQEETDIYRSFIRYQTRLLDVFDQLVEQHDMNTVNADSDVREVFITLRRGITPIVQSMKGARL